MGLNSRQYRYQTLYKQSEPPTQLRLRPETSPQYWVPRYQQWLTLSQIAYRKQQDGAR